MFRGIRAKFLAFRAGERGVVLFLVALLMVPFVALLGVAVDVGELLLVKNQLAAAIDAAALDIGATPGLTQAQANAQAQAFVNANFAAQYPSATVSSLNVTLSQTQASGGCPANTVCITASASVNTAFVRILGSQFNTLSAGVSTQVTTAQNYLEVVLVLDNTGSMASMYGSMPGIQGERLAATTLVNTLFASDPTQQYVKIGIVPFTANVKLPQEFVSNLPWWIDNAQHNNTAGPMSQENLGLPTNKGLVDFANQLATATNNSSWAWSGCVRQRTEMVNGVRVDYDVKDVAPTSSIPETLFTPFFAPDEPDAAHRNGKDNCNGQ
jgi:Flp pilus assembly protein TadG